MHPILSRCTQHIVSRQHFRSLKCFAYLDCIYFRCFLGVFITWTGILSHYILLTISPSLSLSLSLSLTLHHPYLSYSLTALSHSHPPYSLSPLYPSLTHSPLFFSSTTYRPMRKRYLNSPRSTLCHFSHYRACVTDGEYWDRNDELIAERARGEWAVEERKKVGTERWVSLGWELK